MRADTVAVTSSGVLGREGLRRLAWQLEGSDTGLLLSPELTDVAGPRVNVRPVGGLSLLQVDRAEIQRRQPACSRRLIDRTLAALALLVLAPVLAVDRRRASSWTAAARCFFRQTRSGIAGKPFPLVKFRSMVADAEDLLIDLTDQNEGARRPVQDAGATPGSPGSAGSCAGSPSTSCRSCGTSLNGDMSLVGPRPPLPTRGRAVRATTSAAGCSSSPASPASGRSAAAPTSRGRSPSGSTSTTSRTGPSCSTS